MLEKINQYFGISISPIRSECVSEVQGVQLDSDLYQKLLDKTEGLFGEQILVLGISPESYMRYKNGKISSIIKGETGFKSHEGFEAVNMVAVVDSIFSEVNQYFASKVMSEFQLVTNAIFLSINSMRTDLLNQAFYFKEQEFVEGLISVQDFFSEINDELGHISVSEVRSAAYITNLVDIRRQIYRSYNHFIKKMCQWPGLIGGVDNLGNSIAIDFNSLHNDYYFCRQAISCYMVSLVYEYILAGSVDDKSCELIVRKVRVFLEKFKSIDEQIRMALARRDAANKNWFWNFRVDKQMDSGSINWFLNQFNDDPDFEVTKVLEVFSRSRRLLGEIKIVEK